MNTLSEIPPVRRTQTMFCPTRFRASLRCNLRAPESRESFLPDIPARAKFSIPQTDVLRQRRGRHLAIAHNRNHVATQLSPRTLRRPWPSAHRLARTPPPPARVFADSRSSYIRKASPMLRHGLRSSCLPDMENPIMKLYFRTFPNLKNHTLPQF